MRTLIPLLTLAALALGQTPPPAAELLVWTGAKPQGKTWARLGPGGALEPRPGAGHNGHPQGLVLHVGKAAGWRGAGLNWKGWSPPDAATDASRFTSLTFHVRQVTQVGQAELLVSLIDNGQRPGNDPPGNAVAVVAEGGVERLDGTWRRVVLPLAKFTQGKPLRLDRLWEIDFATLTEDELEFQIDRIGFTREAAAARKFPAEPAYTATVRVEAGRELHAVPEGIYGVCGLPDELLTEFGIPATRWGGNPASRYNWKINADNGAADWYFKNRGQPLKDPGESGYLRALRAARRRGATTYQTVPMLGWVAKDHHSYGFAVEKYGVQQATEPGHSDVGNGRRPDGRPVTGNDPRDTAIDAPPAFVAEAVAQVVKHAGRADAGGVRWWALDNEPMLWHVTHRDVFPRPLGYDDLWKRTVAYAEAIKGADPTAQVAGFCSWGWTDLHYAAADEGGDRYRTRPDWQAHGRVSLGEWFIRQCAAYRKQAGQPLVDVFDLHWYPQGRANGQGVYQGKGMGPELNRLRLRAPRELWDPAYRAESWIGNTTAEAPAVLPRVRQWIADHNPGMGLCVGEYNFGGADNVTGGLAQADVFGILARERADLAFLWHTPEGSQVLAWRLFRSYDGKGGRFGDRLLGAASDQADLAAYAGRRTADGATTVVLINKRLGGPCTVTLAGLPGGYRAWRFDQDSGAKVVPVPEAAGPLTLPPASATVVVFAGGGG